jgi:hypothetical protein
VFEGKKLGSQPECIFEACFNNRLGVWVKGIQGGGRLEVTGLEGIGKHVAVMEHHVWCCVIQLLDLGQEMEVFE